MVYSESFPVTIPTGATTTNVNEPFVPFTVNVPINSTVVWTNNDTNVHTVTSGLPEQGASGILILEYFPAAQHLSLLLTKQAVISITVRYIHLCVAAL